MLAYWGKTYVCALTALLAIDMVWLGLVARTFYRKQIGFLLADEVNWWAASAFYVLFGAGVLVFAVAPALEARDLDHRTGCDDIPGPLEVG